MKRTNAPRAKTTDELLEALTDYGLCQVSVGDRSMIFAVPVIKLPKILDLNTYRKADGTILLAEERPAAGMGRPAGAAFVRPRSVAKVREHVTEQVIRGVGAHRVVEDVERDVDQVVKLARPVLDFYHLLATEEAQKAFVNFIANRSEDVLKLATDVAIAGVPDITGLFKTTYSVLGLRVGGAPEFENFMQGLLTVPLMAGLPEGKVSAEDMVVLAQIPEQMRMGIFRPQWSYGEFVLRFTKNGADWQDSMAAVVHALESIAWKEITIGAGTILRFEAMASIFTSSKGSRTLYQPIIEQLVKDGFEEEKILAWIELRRSLTIDGTFSFFLPNDQIAHFTIEGNAALSLSERAGEIDTLDTEYKRWAIAKQERMGLPKVEGKEEELGPVVEPKHNLISYRKFLLVLLGIRYRAQMPIDRRVKRRCEALEVKLECYPPGWIRSLGLASSSYWNPEAVRNINKLLGDYPMYHRWIAICVATSSAAFSRIVRSGGQTRGGGKGRRAQTRAPQTLEARNLVLQKPASLALLASIKGLDKDALDADSTGAFVVRYQPVGEQLKALIAATSATYGKGCQYILEKEAENGEGKRALPRLLKAFYDDGLTGVMLTQDADYGSAFAGAGII